MISVICFFNKQKHFSFNYRLMTTQWYPKRLNYIWKLKKQAMFPSKEEANLIKSCKPQRPSGYWIWWKNYAFSRNQWTNQTLSHYFIEAVCQSIESVRWMDNLRTFIESTAIDAVSKTTNDLWSTKKIVPNYLLLFLFALEMLVSRLNIRLIWVCFAWRWSCILTKK